MGGAISNLWKKLGGPKSQVDAIDTAETIISVIPAINTYYAAFTLVLKTLGLFDEEGTLAEQIDKIYKIVMESLGAIRAEGVAERWRDVTVCQNVAIGQMEITRDNHPGDETFDAASLEDKSRNAVKNLGSDAFWSRPFYEDDIHKDDWYDPLKPPTFKFLGAEMVYDYRWALPTYLQAISCRMIVLPTIKSTYKETHKEEFRDYANNLLKWHEVIRKAIVPMRKIHMIDVFGLWSSFGGSNWEDLSCRFPTQWHCFNRKYGAIELLSGLSSEDEWGDISDYCIGTKLKSQELTLAREADLYFNKFLPKLAVRTFRHKSNIYIALGLPTIWNLINEFRFLAGDPSEDDAINYSILSLQETFREINDLRKEMGGEPLPEGISIRKLASILEVKDLISFRKILEEC